MPDGSTGNAGQELEFQLYKSRFNDDDNIVEGEVRVGDFVLAECVRARSAMRFTVNLPKYGKYRLDIGQHYNDTGHDEFDAYCEYLIINEKPGWFEPFPRGGDATWIYGVTKNAREIGFKPANDESAVLEADDGIVELEFISKPTVGIGHRLQRVEVDVKAITDNFELQDPKCVCHYRYPYIIINIYLMPSLQVCLQVPVCHYRHRAERPSCYDFPVNNK